MSIAFQNKTIKMYKGDTGTLIVKGIPTDKNYKVYFAVSDCNKKILSEISVESNSQSSVTFLLTADFTNKLPLDVKKPYEVYFYGVKICDPDRNLEDTAFVKGTTFGSVDRFMLYPEKAAGLVNDDE